VFFVLQQKRVEKLDTSGSENQQVKKKIVTPFLFVVMAKLTIM